jgi:hypothetical protein
MPFVNERLGNDIHLLDKISTTGIGIGTQDVQRIHVFIIGFDKGGDDFLPILAGISGSYNDFIIDISEILHVVDIVSTVLQPTVDKVEGDVTSGMAKVATVVYRNPTDVHLDLPRLEGRKLDLFSTA